MGVSCSFEGSLLIWLTSNGQIRRVLEGHVGDVHFCKFFPSGLVVLSGGADIRLKIWSAEDGSSPVTLIGHTRGLNDACPVEKGKNVVSVSRDGQCKLYDVGEAKCLSTFAKYDTIVNACAIQNLSSVTFAKLDISSQNEDEFYSEREVGTENKIVALGGEDGFLRLVALRSRKQFVELNCESAVNCCCFLNETTVVCGTQDGFVFQYDFVEKVLKSWKEFRSSILSIVKSFGPTGFIATTADGSCFTANLNKLVGNVDFIGSDCDPVYKAVSNQTHVFTCCRDGAIRKYNIKQFKDEPEI